MATPTSCTRAGSRCARRCWAPSTVARRSRPADFTREFEELVTRYCFGEVWGREGISPRARGACSRSRCWSPSGAPTRSGAREGRDQQRRDQGRDREVLMHSAIYCGIPAAVDGFRNATAVLRTGLDERPGRDPTWPGRVRRPRQHGLADGRQPRGGGLPPVVSDATRPQQRSPPGTAGSPPTVAAVVRRGWASS